MLLKRKFTTAKYSNGFCRFIFSARKAEKGMILFATCIEMPLYLCFTREKEMNRSKKPTLFQWRTLYSSITVSSVTAFYVKKEFQFWQCERVSRLSSAQQDKLFPLHSSLMQCISSMTSIPLASHTLLMERFNCLADKKWKDGKRFEIVEKDVHRLWTDWFGVIEEKALNRRIRDLFDWWICFLFSEEIEAQRHWETRARLVDGLIYGCSRKAIERDKSRLIIYHLYIQWRRNLMVGCIINHSIVGHYKSTWDIRRKCQTMSFTSWIGFFWAGKGPASDLERERSSSDADMTDLESVPVMYDQACVWVFHQDCWIVEFTENKR